MPGYTKFWGILAGGMLCLIENAYKSTNWSLKTRPDVVVHVNTSVRLQLCYAYASRPAALFQGV